MTSPTQAARHRCPYGRECGGCGLTHLSYPDQLAMKQALVAKLEHLTQGRDSIHGLVLAQFALICRQLGTLRLQAGGLLKLA